MADRNQRNRPEPYPCPFGCGVEVPDDARFCPNCKKQVVEHCIDCGRRIKRPRGDKACPGCGALPITVVGTATPVAQSTNKCKFCGAAHDANATRCPQCNSFTKSFKRLCTSCKKEVGLTDNDCKHCGVHFTYSLDDGHKIFRHIQCRKCSRPPVEYDDWMVLRSIPFVFQTEAGVKIAALQSHPQGEDIIRHYFGEDDLATWRSGNDQEPWDFPTNRQLIEFLNNFACLCKQKDWKLARLHGAWKHAQPHVQTGSKAAGSFLVEALKQMAKALGLMR